MSRQCVGGWLQLCVGLLLIVTLARTLCSHLAAIVSGLCRSSTRLCFAPPPHCLPLIYSWLRLALGPIGALFCPNRCAVIGLAHCCHRLCFDFPEIDDFCCEVVIGHYYGELCAVMSVL
jgi:hypothetical protein